MAHDKPFPLATALAVPIADLETAEWDTLVIVAETTESLTGSLDKDIKAALSDVQKVRSHYLHLQHSSFVVLL